MIDFESTSSETGAVASHQTGRLIAAGLVLAACGASPAVIATVAGIAPGALLLGSVRWSLRTR